MKKTLLLLVLLLAFSEAYTQKFYVGIKGGVNLATLTGSNDTLSKKSLSGYHMGVLVNMGVSDVLSLQPELTYSKKGVVYDYTTVPSLQGRIILNYINVTLLAKAMFGGETIRGFVNAGPYAGYLVSGKAGLIVNGVDFVGKFNFATQKEIKRLDLGAIVGAGTTFRAGPGDVIVDLRYSLGLLTVNDKPELQVFKGAKYANSVIEISVGYVVPLGDFY